jgi:uncharacterized protein (TIGR03545 family)
MKTWIRWWGLVSFLLVFTCLAVFWLVFVDGIVRRAIEKTGTAIIGAEVDVHRAEVTLAPLAIAISGIAVTDPESPSNNSIEISRVVFSLDGLNLLRRKVIINEMSMEGLRFDTRRTKPGFVVKPREKKPDVEKKPSFTLLSLELPSAKQVLASEQIESLALIESAQADIRRARENWEKRIHDLPDRSKLNSYRERVERLKSAPRKSLKDLSTHASALKDLTNDIDQDIARVKEARTSFQTDLMKAKEAADRAERAPREDITRIAGKYGLSMTGFQNASRTLFGRSIGSWFDTGAAWFGRLRPLFSGSRVKKGNVTIAKPVRARGVDVRFRERSPLPDLLIRHVKASMDPPAGNFSGIIRNITPDQDIFGAPLTFAFLGNGLQSVSSLEIDGALNHVRPATPDDSMRIIARGYKAKDLVLSQHQDLPVTLQEGLVDLEITGRHDGSVFSVRLVSSMRSALLQAGKQGSSDAITESIRSSLAKVKNFSLTADITGTPENYDMRISSDLDRVFRDAIGRVVGELAIQFEKDLATALQAKTDGRIQDLRSVLSGLASLGGNIDILQSDLNKLLSESTMVEKRNIKLPF